MEVIKKEYVSDIQKDINQKRLKMLSEHEKRLEDFKRRQGKGNPENDLIFSEMLAQYGNTVKQVDQDLEREKAK